MRDFLERLADFLILIGVVLFAIFGMVFGLSWLAATWSTLFEAFGL